MSVIKKTFTTGLCGVCYCELPAQIEYRDDNAAYITKHCPTHGYEETMVEVDWKFWDAATQKNPHNDTWKEYNNVSIIEITDRCNVQCKHCYQMPDNSIPDKSTQHIVKLIEAAPTEKVCLMGAEPTMREDLPEIIREAQKFNKKISIYTNGVKLQKENYINELMEAGLCSVNMSIHNPSYHDLNIWKNVQRGLRNASQAGIKFGQVSFTVETKEEVELAMNQILWVLSNVPEVLRPQDFCIRSPSEIGLPFEKEREIFASEIFTWIREVALDKKLSFIKHPNHGSNPYHVGGLLVDPKTQRMQTIQIIHWANVKSVDTSFMYMGPWASFMPNTWSTFLIQAILRDGLRKGWYQGHAIMKNKDSIRPVVIEMPRSVSISNKPNSIS
jgi:organic radical activating enzyme